MNKNACTRNANPVGRAPNSPLRTLKLVSFWARAGAFALVAACLLAVAPRQKAQVDCNAVPSGCQESRRTKLVFLLDRSGSMAQRGQTYNAQIDAIARALRNPAIIPRDGSIEVGIIAFAEAANVVTVAGQPLTRLDSFAAAEAVAKAVEALKCGNLASQVFPCPFGATSFEAAILAADVLVSQSGEKGAQRLLVMSTDGQTSDADAAQAACRVRAARNAAVAQGITFEFDAILVGLDPASAEFAENKARVDRVVMAQDVAPNCAAGGSGGGQTGLQIEPASLVEPQTVDQLPGATLVVNGGLCAAPGAAPGTPDCEEQISLFVTHIDNILLQRTSAISLVVNTDADTAPGTPPAAGATLSLRQAIERANCNGGFGIIKFAESLRGATIRPLVPLPAITGRGTSINNGCNGTTCDRLVTIDGTDTDTTKGEAHSDGILIRASRTAIYGLTIRNFKRAGIAVDPICPQDVTVENSIASNILEGNAVAGVLVKDPNPQTARAFLHSVNNQISQNDISDSATLIDLGGDGPTPNDAGDVDEGPNHLLNFPDALTVTAVENNLVRASGQVGGPAAGRSSVELYAVTKFRVVNNALVIDGVRFLATIGTLPDGTFEAGAFAPSPTGIYTALVMDEDLNTSELMFDSAVKPARAIAAAATPINFGDVNVGSPSTPRPIQITNTGNAPLIITNCSIVVCAPNDPNNTARFAITGCPTAPINPGATATVNAVFTPNACGAVKACVQFATNDPARATITSELNGTGNATGQGRLVLEGGGSSLDFGTVGAKPNGLKLKKQPRRSVTIENTGCQPLTLTFGNFVRTGADTTNGKITNPNDNTFFSVVALSSSGVESPVTNPVVIAPRETRTFRIRFRPIIPAVSSQTTGLAASEVLPDTVTSQLQIAQAGGSPLLVNLVGRVTTDVKLINPANPATGNPIVSFRKAGDEFTVEFSVFDSNLSVNRASYQFFDNPGRAVGQTFDIDLASQIQQRGLVRGQSFTVTQKFTGAEDNDNVTRVQIVINDGETTLTTSADLILGVGLSIQSSRRSEPRIIRSDKKVIKAVSQRVQEREDAESESDQSYVRRELFRRDLTRAGSLHTLMNWVERDGDGIARKRVAEPGRPPEPSSSNDSRRVVSGKQKEKQQ